VFSTCEKTKTDFYAQLQPVSDMLNIVQSDSAKEADPSNIRLVLLNNNLNKVLQPFYLVIEKHRHTISHTSTGNISNID